MSEPVTRTPRPANEKQRLAALERLGITSTPPEERFDRIVRMATRLFRVPISFISLVEADTLWIKSQEGACRLSLSRDESFCGHTILAGKALIVPDARQDPRFLHLPMVEGEPFIRFYAGRPLEVEHGCQVGSLCLVDREVRRFTETEQELFEQLGDLVEHELRLVHTLHLEDGLLESQKELALEKRRNDELLRTILPDHVAEELRRRGSVTAAAHPQVCVLSCDFPDFRTAAARLPAEEVVRELNDCFAAFDEIADQFHVDKLRTTAGGYLCVSGLVERQGPAAERILEAGFAMRNFVEQRRAGRRREGRDAWAVRIGIHAGPVVGGLLGGRRYAFDVWGDTVDAAVQLGRAGTAGKISASEEFLKLVKDEVEFTPRGLGSLAAAGDRPMFFVESFKAGFAAT
jgi:adenylate cyclase